MRLSLLSAGSDRARGLGDGPCVHPGEIGAAGGNRICGGSTEVAQAGEIGEHRSPGHRVRGDDGGNSGGGESVPFLAQPGHVMTNQDQPPYLFYLGRPTAPKCT